MYVFLDSKDGYTTHLYDSFVAGRGKGPCSNEQSVMTILPKREVKCLEVDSHKGPNELTASLRGEG